MRYTRLRSNASARATPERLTSSDQSFVLHSGALHRIPFDGHTLDAATTDIEKNAGIEIKRADVDKGFRGHNHPNKCRI